MPHKFNTSRRHKFAKKKYRVTNWCGYNESLRNRGDLTVWITGDARKHWAAPRRRSRGGQPRYSDLAITMCLTLGMVYRLPLRQTQGLIRSISKLMLLEISVPDFSTLSRRGRGLSLPARPKIKITDPVHLAAYSGISAHLFRQHPPICTGVSGPALTRCREALVFDISFLAFRHVVEGLSFGRIVRRVRAGRRCAPAGRGWHLRRWVHQ